MLIIKQVKLERFIQKKSRLDILFSTQEEPSQIEQLQLEKSKGYLAFNSDQYKKQVEELIKNKRLSVDYLDRTKSQILRGVLSEVALQNNWNPEVFYGQEMNRIISHYRKKLK